MCMWQSKAGLLGLAWVSKSHRPQVDANYVIFIARETNNCGKSALWLEDTPAL